LTAAGTTNTELVTQGGTTLRNGLPGVQALTTSGYGTSYVQRDPNGGLLALVTGSGATGEYYYVLDAQSSVIGLVDAAGTERARYTYDPYGAHDTATAVNGALPDNPYRYASGRAVALNAANQVVLYQYGQRFYQRATGRWTQQDNLEALGDPTEGNRYAYVGGDPVNKIDPCGRMSIDVPLLGEIECWVNCMNGNVDVDCALSCGWCALDPLSNLIDCANCAICAGPAGLECARVCF
jgi:RHS repeat-associated protein